jgi:NhaP-type Na+/H+ or K+/H+ antiporter
MKWMKLTLMMVICACISPLFTTTIYGDWNMPIAFLVSACLGAFSQME